MQDSSPYTEIISPRSRRLRTIGIVLLVAVFLMALYGYFGLMPALQRALRTNTRPAIGRHVKPGAATVAVDEMQNQRAYRARKLQVSVALAYWGVCSLLLVSVLVVAWLDFREISNRYVEQRRAMWVQAADRVDSTDDSP